MAAYSTGISWIGQSAFPYSYRVPQILTGPNGDVVSPPTPRRNGHITRLFATKSLAIDLIRSLDLTRNMSAVDELVS